VIETTYFISQAEFIAAHKMWATLEYKRLPGRTLQSAACVIFGCALVVSFLYMPIGIAVALYMSLVAIILIGHWRRGEIRKYQYSQNAKQMEGLHVRIDDSGYWDEKTGIAGGWIAWTSFTGWLESPSVFVIGRNLTFTTVPKSALSTEQQQELRSLLQSHIGPANQLIEPPPPR